jgi:hypothetical protein
VQQLIEDFRLRKGDILTQVEIHGVESISSFCAMVGIPLVAAYTYIKEDMPEYAEFCENRIEELCEFYGYKRSR